MQVSFHNKIGVNQLMLLNFFRLYLSSYCDTDSMKLGLKGFMWKPCIGIGELEELKMLKKGENMNWNIEQGKKKCFFFLSDNQKCQMECWVQNMVWEM